jgi:hypothetical protein
MDTEQQGAFAALTVPNFRRYVTGQSLSLIDTWVETVARALLVLHLTHSGTVLGLTTAAPYAPILLLSPHAALLVGGHRLGKLLRRLLSHDGDSYLSVCPSGGGPRLQQSRPCQGRI